MRSRPSLRRTRRGYPPGALATGLAVKMVDRFLERVAADEPHGIVGAAVGVGAQAVDRHDARMFEPAGDLGLLKEPLPADRVISVGVEDLLERNLAVQLAVDRHENSSEPALGVRTQDAKSAAV